MANASIDLPNKACYIIQLEIFSKHTVRRKELKTTSFTSQFLVRYQ